MAKSDEEAEFKDDALAQAFRFRTVWTNTLFERGNNVLTISRFGKFNFRIEKAAIYWTVAGILISLLIIFTVFKWILPPDLLFFVGGLFTLFFTLILVQIGMWSPMKKSTGEDLITYLKFMARNKFSSGGLFAKQSKSVYVSKAFKNHPDGRPISGKMWLGTQPLATAVTTDMTSKNDKMEYQFYPRGDMKNVDIGRYNAKDKHRRLN